jgi:hypothetical protein
VDDYAAFKRDEGLNWSTNAYVQTWDGYTGIAQGIYPRATATAALTAAAA